MVEANGVSRFGLHRRHVIRYGKRVSDRAIEELGENVKIQAVVRYEEDGLGLHHLRVYWREENKKGLRDGGDTQRNRIKRENHEIGREVT